MTAQFNVFIFLLYSLKIFSAQAAPSKESRNFRVATFYHAPFVIPATEEGAGFKGLLIDLMTSIADTLKLNIDYQLLREPQYGHVSANGTWNGIIGELVADRADIGLAALTITPLRMKAVKFSFPYLTTGIVALGRKRTFPFNKENLMDLVNMSKNDEIVLGTLQGGSTMNFFRESDSPELAAILHEINRRPDSLVLNYNSGINRVRMSAEPDYVFFGEKFVLEFAVEQSCDLKSLMSDPLNIINYGVAFSQKVTSKIMDQFNSALLDLQTSGFVQMLKRRWYQSQCLPADYAELCSWALPASQLEPEIASSYNRSEAMIVELSEIQQSHRRTLPNQSRIRAVNATEFLIRIAANLAND